MVQWSDSNSAQFHPDTDDIFSRIATDYDRYCDIFSLLIHRIWKRAFARQVASEQGETCLDLASGTGDIAIRVLDLVASKKQRLHVDVFDICQPMLDVAVPKLARFTDVRVRILDACDMSEVPDGSYDVISMAFGMKIIDRTRALAEIFRCLKPGGVFLNIDASVIPIPALQWLYLRYMDFALPLIGRLVANGDSSAYSYLLRGVHEFPGPAAFADELRAHRFVSVTFRSVTLGIVAIHRAVKPASAIA